MIFSCVGRRKPSRPSSTSSALPSDAPMNKMRKNASMPRGSRIEKSETRSKPIPVPSGGGQGEYRHSTRRRGSSLLSEMNDMTTLVKQCNQCGDNLLLWCDGAAMHRYARVGDHNFGFCGDECWAEWLNARTSAASSLSESMGTGSCSNPARSPLRSMSTSFSYTTNQNQQQERSARSLEETKGGSMCDNNNIDADDIALAREQDDSPEAYLNKIISDQLKSLKYHTTSSSLHSSIVGEELADSSQTTIQKQTYGSTSNSLPTKHGMRLSNPNQQTEAPTMSNSPIQQTISVPVASAPRVQRSNSDAMWGDDSCANNTHMTTKTNRARSSPLSHQLRWRSLNNSEPRSLLAAALSSGTIITMVETEHIVDSVNLI